MNCPHLLAIGRIRCTQHLDFKFSLLSISPNCNGSHHPIQSESIFCVPSTNQIAVSCPRDAARVMTGCAAARWHAINSGRLFHRPRLSCNRLLDGGWLVEEGEDGKACRQLEWWLVFLCTCLTCVCVHLIYTFYGDCCVVFLSPICGENRIIRLSKIPAPALTFSWIPL